MAAQVRGLQPLHMPPMSPWPLQPLPCSIGIGCYVVGSLLALPAAWMLPVEALRRKVRAAAPACTALWVAFRWGRLAAMGPIRPAESVLPATSANVHAMPPLPPAGRTHH